MGESQGHPVLTLFIYRASDFLFSLTKLDLRSEMQILKLEIDLAPTLKYGQYGPKMNHKSTRFNPLTAVSHIYASIGSSFTKKINQPFVKKSQKYTKMQIIKSFNSIRSLKFEVCAPVVTKVTKQDAR